MKRASLDDGSVLPAGRLAAVRGAVVEVEFDAELPAINEELRVSAGPRIVVLEVAHHLDAHTVRAIALAHTEGLARGMVAERTGRPITVPVGPPTLGRLFNALGQPLDGGGPPPVEEWWPIHRPAPPLTTQQRSLEFMETGIKVIDLLAPLARGGKAGLIGGAGGGVHRPPWPSCAAGKNAGRLRGDPGRDLRRPRGELAVHDRRCRGGREMTMNLEILVPDGVVLDTPIRGLRAADTSGLFGLWPNHQDFATLLVPCVVSYRDEENREHYAAVDGGVLVLQQGHVSIGTREAVLADHIEEVADAAAAMLAARNEEERTARAEFAELQAALLRELPKTERRT